MRKTSLVLALMAAWFANGCAQAAHAAEPTGDQPAGAVGVADMDGQVATARDALSLAELEALVEPVPEARRVFTHTYRAGQVTSREETADGRAASQAGLPGEELIYSNTGGTGIFKLGVPNQRMADDLQTDALVGCDLSRYVVRVNGGVVNGTGQFACKTALYDGCPSAGGGATLISGSDATFPALGDNSADFHDLVVDVSLNPIPIPIQLWVRVECDTALAGWVAGIYPELGFSKDSFFFPPTGCDSFLSSTFYGGFYAQIYAVDDPLAPCRTHYPAYATTAPHGSFEGLYNSNRFFAEDFETGLAPTGDACILSGYEVAARGFSGWFNMNTDLRFPFTDFPIPGTEMVFQAYGDGRTVLARHRVDPVLAIIVPASPLWMTWETDVSKSSLMLADGPAIGWTDPNYLYDQQCHPLPCPWLGLGEAPGTFYLRVFCWGENATGACCTFDEGQPTASCVDTVLAADCVEGRWAKYEKCVDDPFDPPCAASACPGGIVEWLLPESATVVDARQPVDPGDPSVPQGVTSLAVAAPLNAADPSCWSLCDTLGNLLGNKVNTVSEDDDGTLTLHLQFPITAGAETVIAYAGHGGGLTGGAFSFLPGDIDGQNGVLASTDCANFADLCLSGLQGTVLERCDIDRSGVLSSSDLIRLIDLMNGAGPFDPWLGRTVSSGTCE